MRYGDLHEVPGAFLYCPEDGGEFSATPGDYFWADPADEIKCGCNEPLLLMTARRVLTEVS